MFLSVAHFFNVLIFLDLTLAIICCILVIQVPARYAVKLTVIPLILFITYILLVHGNDMLGRPVNTVPVGQFEFIDYRVIETNGIKEIELWIIQDKKSRLHVVPYSSMTEQDLSKAKTKKRAGKKSRGEFGGRQGHGIESDGPKLRLSEIQVENILPPKEDE